MLPKSIFHLLLGGAYHSLCQHMGLTPLNLYLSHLLISIQLKEAPLPSPQDFARILAHGLLSGTLLYTPL